MRPQPDRSCRGRRFAWSRRTAEDGRIYRLFRRDLRGAVHMQELAIDAGEDARTVAAALRIVRRRLLDQLTETDLALMQERAAT